jgi:uncharacterized membrane protein
MEYVLGGLVILAIPIAGIAAFFMAIGLRHRVDYLEQRLNLLQARLAQASPPAATPAPPRSAAEPAKPAPIPEAPPQETSTPPPRQPEPTLPREGVAVSLSPPPGRDYSGLEERFGTRWVVYVGGLALALGGIFLVRYSIEQGLLGPGMRIFFGAVFAAGLVLAGEWMRRQEQPSALAGIPAAHIPSILTAAGTTVAYATIYSAYALYAFVGPAAAFVLLGLVALATLGAALLHGPALAGLGLVGAYVTPLLVASEQPNYWALYLYLAVVSAAAFALARMRMWRWLAITAVALGCLWMLPGIDDMRALTPHALYAAVGFALVAALMVSGFLYGPAAAPGEIDTVSSGAMAAYLLAAALLVLASHHDPFALGVFAALVAACVVIAWRTEAAIAAVPAAVVLVALVFWLWAVAFNVETTIAPGGPAAGLVPEPARFATGFHLTLGSALAALFALAGFLAQGRSERPLAPMLWAASAVVAPVAILIALYYRIAGFERSIPFAAIALALAALYGYATELLNKRPPRPGVAAAGAIFATGGIAALALALTFALEKGWLTVGLALMVPGIAWIEQQRPLPALRWVAAAVIVLVLARIGWNPRIVGSDVGTTPVFNWLLYGYGVPAVCFWLAGYLLRRRADDVPARMADSAAILFTALTVSLEIRHYIHNGDIYRASSGLTEIALQVCTGLAMTIGLERVRGRTNSIVHNVGALVIAGMTLLAIVFGLVLFENPLLSGRIFVGGLVFNLILLGYGLPAVLAAALALITRQTRPEGYRAVAAVTAVGLALLYLTLEVARVYQGPQLRLSAVSDAEQYTYSAVWLVFGVALLVVGIVLRSQPVRLCSAAVVLMTVGKVFLFDLAGLTGVFRAFSFIGLGLVLVGIGWLYQRLLFPPRPAANATVAPH